MSDQPSLLGDTATAAPDVSRGDWIRLVRLLCVRAGHIGFTVPVHPADPERTSIVSTGDSWTTLEEEDPGAALALEAALTDLPYEDFGELPDGALWKCAHGRAACPFCWGDA